ncbi:MAG TPA: uroporphyrinogen-III synthase [Anaerolineae bacterium]|jgi:uroporphyrinogen-III synthase
MMPSLPLNGRRVLVTRARAQSDGLTAQLAMLGAQVIALATIEIAPMPDSSLLDAAIAHLTDYDWVIFTSVNGVAAFWQRLKDTGANAHSLQHLAVAAIGPATAQALREQGINPQFVPSEYVAEAIASGIGAVAGKHILLPRAEIARDALAVALRQRGAKVDEVPVYRTLPPAPDAQALDELRRGVDAILFTSSSTVRNFIAMAGRDTGAAVIACIGPITAQTARELGMPVDVIASEYTTDGLVRALVAHYQHKQQAQEK